MAHGAAGTKGQVPKSVGKKSWETRHYLLCIVSTINFVKILGRRAARRQSSAYSLLLQQRNDFIVSRNKQATLGRALRSKPP